MSDLDPLIRDMLVWLAREPRSHAEVLDAWRTSCPRLTVWEDALDRGLVTRARQANGHTLILLTDAGHAFLQSQSVRA